MLFRGGALQPAPPPASMPLSLMARLIGKSSAINANITTGGGGGLPTGLIQSIPLGGGAFTVQQSGGSAGVASNGDGTQGYQSGGLWLVLQTWFNFPADEFYQFVVPAFTASIAAIPYNSIQVYVDQLMLPSDAGTTSNLNWFMQFVTNTSPSHNYSWTAPVKQGWHSIQIYMNNAAYFGVTGTTSGNANIHGDRLNIIGTGNALPSEPAGSRDATKFPYSSLHFLNTPFGSSATWRALSDPVAQTINGTGGNGAHIAVNTASFSTNVWTGQSTDPVFNISTNDAVEFPTSPISTPIPVRCPAGSTQSGDNADQNCAMIDGTNPRYHYTGLGGNSRNRTMPFYRVLIGDNYNLNHATPQSASQFPGLIRVADLDNNVIAHRLVAGLGFSNGTTTGYGPASQTSQWSGLPWPGCESDAAWHAGGEYVNPNGVPYGSVGGIPPSQVKPGGLNAQTSMMWDCLQHYGMFFNVTAGTYPSVTLAAEGAAAGHPMLQGITWSSIIPHLSVMSNPQPIVVGQGFGGGAPVVSLLPGITQGLPSIGQSPFTFPSSPVGIPIQIAAARPGLALSAGTNSGASGAAGQGNTTGVTVPIGSFVFVVLSLDRAAAANFVSPFSDSVGNSYTVIQPAAGSDFNPALAVCLSTTVAIGNGVTWSPTMTPGGLANYFFLGAYYRPKPPTGSTSTRISNSNTTGSSVTTLSTTLAGVQTNDLVIGFTYTSAYAEIVNPGSMGSLNPIPPLNIAFQLATSSGTFTFNPTWNNASAAAVVAAAFANTNITT